jgi:pimeloyl-ACP methyl ester carboxylesterase
MRQLIKDIPITVIHGTADIWVPVVFSRDYASNRERSNVKLIELASIGHFELIDPRHRIMEILLEELGIF